MSHFISLQFRLICLVLLLRSVDLTLVVCVVFLQWCASDGDIHEMCM